jgi:hypothetical protein
MTIRIVVNKFGFAAGNFGTRVCARLSALNSDG